MTGADSTVAMQSCSREAALVLMGFEPPNEPDELQKLDAIRAEMGDLRRIILVYSAGGHSLSA